jgi:hypothetical protein
MTPVPFDWSSVSRRPGGSIWRLVKPCGLTLVWSQYARCGIRVPVSLVTRIPFSSLNISVFHGVGSSKLEGSKGSNCSSCERGERGSPGLAEVRLSKAAGGHLHGFSGRSEIIKNRY